jgi:hypothetical protein
MYFVESCLALHKGKVCTLWNLVYLYKKGKVFTFWKHHLYTKEINYFVEFIYLTAKEKY